MAGWFGRISALWRTRDKYEESSRLVLTGRTQAGVYVTPDNALQNAAVWGCVNYLSRTVAQLPWRVMRDVTGGGSEVARAHPVDYLLSQRPCIDMGSFTWRQTLLGHALLWGNGYAEIERDARGVPVSLWPIHPRRVCVKRGTDNALYYEVTDGPDGTVYLPANDVFHVRGFGDGMIGFGVIEYAAQSIGWARATELFGASYFGEGMNPTGIIETAKGLTPPAMEVLRQQFKKLYSGPKGEKTAILDAGMKFTKISSSPEESQFIDVRQHQVEEICRWFGVPPHKIQHLLRTTFSNIENQAIEVVVDTIIPWVKIFEEEANYKLFGANRAGLFTKMNLNGLLRGDSASRAAFYKTMREMGVMSVNEIRALEDLNPIGPEGDKRIVQMNMTTLERIGEEPVVDPMASLTSSPDTAAALARVTH